MGDSEGGLEELLEEDMEEDLEEDLEELLAEDLEEAILAADYFLEVTQEVLQATATRVVLGVSEVIMVEELVLEGLVGNLTNMTTDLIKVGSFYLMTFFKPLFCIVLDTYQVDIINPS